jgi:hypothetical protein
VADALLVQPGAPGVLLSPLVGLLPGLALDARGLVAARAQSFKLRGGLSAIPTA